MRDGLAQQFGVSEPVHQRHDVYWKGTCGLEPAALTCTSSPELPLHALQLGVHLSQPCLQMLQGILHASRTEGRALTVATL